MIEEFGLGSFKFERKDKPGEGGTTEENTKALQDIVKAINMIADSANKEE